MVEETRELFYGDVDISITKGKITNIYGGGNYGSVDGSTSTTINSGTITNLYGGGNNGAVKGDSEIIIKQGTINTAFGGGHLGLVEGNTNVVVGNSTNPYVTISNVLYGGGEGPGNDATYETVLGNATVLIEGLNTNVENYGSALLGKVDGEVNVTFKDYWTGNSTDKYKVMNGIDRATNVYFDNSYILLVNRNQNGDLEGIKDITNLYVPDGSGLKVSAPGELLGDFHGGGNFYLDSEVCLTIHGDIYGSTLLVLNPLLTSGVNMIKGTENNPYMKIGGTDYSTNYTALYSIDGRYPILHAVDSSNYGLYYIPRDVIVNDELENTVFHATGVRYTENISEWSTQDIYVRDSGVYTANVDSTVNFQIPRESTQYQSVTRSVSMVSRDVVRDLPANTIISLYKGGKLFSRKLTTNTSEVYLSTLTNINNSGENFQEITDVKGNATIIGYNEIIGSAFEYDETFRFIVDFSDVDPTQLIPKGPYNFMMNYYDYGMPMTGMQARATNIIKIEEKRKYNTEILTEWDKFEPDRAVLFNAKIGSDEDYILDSLYGNPIYAIVSLVDLIVNQPIVFPENTITKVDGAVVEHANSYFKYKVLDTLTQADFEVTHDISIDMTDVEAGNRVHEGNYLIKIEYYIGTPEEALIEKIVESTKEVEEKYFTYNTFYCTVTQSGLSEQELLTITPSNPTRTIVITYDGDLQGPYTEIKIQRKNGNAYTDIDVNAIAKKVMITGNEQSTVFTRLSSLTNGTYKVVFTLKDITGREKAKEALIFEI